MQKKLTITIDENVYRGLHKVIGRGRISQFIENLLRPHVLGKEMGSAYRTMANDKERESQAFDWSEALSGDALDE
jgi:predicted CopG family antitoxin